jgi:transposase
VCRGIVTENIERGPDRTAEVSGMTGLRILHAIVQGERNAQRLAAMRDRRIKASEEEIAKSLHGNWREELIFVVEENLSLYEIINRKSAVVTSGSSNI